MAESPTAKEIAKAKAAALAVVTIPKHEDLTLPYIPNPTPPTGKELKTRIIVISFLKDGSGRFDVQSSKNASGDIPGDMTEAAIFTKIGQMTTVSTKSLTNATSLPTMIDLEFDHPTKVVFYLNIPNWYFTVITGNNSKTFPFFIKANVNGQRDQRSFEEFRGLKNLVDTTGTIKNLKTIVVYNQLKHTIPKSNFFSHKFGLRMNYNDTHTINGVVVDTVTPIELDPEIKNNG